MDGETWIGIGEAASAVGVSRRTVERWLRDGRLASRASAGDRRRRLVNVSDVAGLARASARRPHRRPSNGPQHGLGGPVVPLPVDDDDPLPSDDQLAVDAVLTMVYACHHRLLSQFFPAAFQPLALRDLREGPLGRDLIHLARYARGEARAPGPRVRTAVEGVLQLLFWPAAADDYVVPARFWDTSVGRVLMAAKYRSFKGNELIDVAAAAERLGVGRATVLRWMDDRTLDYVRDGLTGRVWVVRRDVENVRRVARELPLEERGAETTAPAAPGPTEQDQKRGGGSG